MTDQALYDVFDTIFHGDMALDRVADFYRLP